MPARYYIGLATSPHDPALAIINSDGEVIFAESAERRYQVKKGHGLPPDNIMWIKDIINEFCSTDGEYIITRSWSNKRVNILNIIRALTILQIEKVRKTTFGLLNILPDEHNDIMYLYNSFVSVNAGAGASLERTLRNKSTIKNIKFIAYDHHLTHAASACYASPFNNATCLIADGEGEGGSFSIYTYSDNKIQLVNKQKGPESLGVFYQMLTSLCGFDRLMGEEWKVMGMAAYGKKNDKLYELFRSMYKIEIYCLKYRSNRKNVNNVFKSIQQITANDPDNFSLRADIAYNGQLAYTEWMNELITNIHKQYPADNLILSGGCALNSSYNGHILDNTPFKDLYIPSAPADDGCALGAALVAYYSDNPQKNSRHKDLSPYLGSQITDEQLENFLRFSKVEKIRTLSGDKYRVVAQLLAEGKIVGWVQGRAEYGPRALGNRSILADPRRKEIKDIINERVKFREEFRPFAPSILHEYGHEYFEHYQESHYMERTLTFKKEAIDKVPGVVHVNNTGRLQTVKEEWNQEFYHLLKSFHSITGVPVLLNTSFNIMGKPIIHTVEDAISTFYTTGLDVLVINDYLIEK